MLSPPLFTQDCAARHDSHPIIKFDTTVLGLITENDETAYREEVRDLAVWCQDNNLSLNVIKTKEMIVDYRNRRAEHAPILIDGAAVEQVERLESLGVHITDKLSWSKHTKTVVKRAQQLIFPLRRLKRFGIGPQILKVLQLHHPDWLHHCLVWQPFGLRPQGTTEGSGNGPVHHRGQVSCHPGPLYQAVSEEEKTPATLVIDCSLC